MRLTKPKPTSARSPVAGCPTCGNPDLVTKEVSDTVDFRGLTLDIQGLQHSWCTSCGKKSETQSQRLHNESLIKRAYSEERDVIRKRDGLLSSDEITNIRKSFSLTQRDAAVLFGGGANAFNKYESGEVLQSVAMDRLLRLIDAAGNPALSFLERITQSVRPNFKLCSTVDHPLPSLKALQVIIHEDLATYNLNITNIDTAANVLSAIKGATFEKIDFGHDNLLPQFYLPMDAVSNLTPIFSEIKNDRN